MIATRHWLIGSLAHWLIAFAALALGTFAALGSSEWLAFTSITLAILVAACTLPFSLIPPVLSVFIAFQFYFPLPATSLTLRGALVFVVIIAARVILDRENVARLRDFYRAWMLPAAIFLIAALVAAFGAQNRYTALRGLYDWLVIFLTAFVASEINASAPTHRRMIRALISVGVGEAILGFAQAAVSVDRTIAMLRSPVSEIFIQPNLLRERLNDLSFNWILNDRVVPFGNFINAIDYAIFLAAIVPVALAAVLAPGSRKSGIRLLFSALALGAVIALTLKGSGMLALIGGAITLAIFFAPRVSPRVVVIGGAIALGVLLLIAPFANVWIERATFLIQRELGATTGIGRLAVWAQLIALLPQRALFGFGLNNAINLIEPTPTLIFGAFAFTTSAPESAYISALIETGIVGFVALISLFAITLARAIRNARASRDAIHVGICAAIIALLVGNLTVAGFTTDQNGMLLGLLIGMVFGNWRLEVGS